MQPESVYAHAFIVPKKYAVNNQWHTINFKTLIILILILDAGSSVVLQCSGRGNPPPSIVWRKHNRYCTVLYCTILTVLHNRDLAGLDHMLRQRSGTQHSAECQAMTSPLTIYSVPIPASLVTLCVSGVIIQLLSHGNAGLTHASLQFLPLFVCLMPLCVSRFCPLCSKILQLLTYFPWRI